MSVHETTKRITVPGIMQCKARKSEPIVALTAYHAHTAAIADKYVDILLVGDSVGMVVHGFSSTLPVSLDLMIMHGRAVVRGSSRALVVVDMPFASYEESPQQAFHNAARVIKETGCGAIKIEGGKQMADTIHFLTERGIPVMAHIGLTPQSVNILGGFKTQGYKRAQWGAIEEDAELIAQSGAFSVVLEAMAEPLAAKITQDLLIPTIGIGASPACDGQIMVMEDMLGLTSNTAKFVKIFGRAGEEIDNAIKLYAQEVRSRTFPSEDHIYPIRD